MSTSGEEVETDWSVLRAFWLGWLIGVVTGAVGVTAVAIVWSEIFRVWLR